MDAQLNLAKQQYGNGDFDKSIATCNRILQAEPAHPAALFCRGMCYEAMDDTGAAIEDYERAAAVAPGFKEAEIRAAGCYVANWNFVEALRIYDELTKRYPDWGRVFRERAQLHCNCANYEKERDDLVRAIELGEENADLRFSLFTTLDLLGEKVSALAHLNRAIELDPENEGYRRERALYHPDIEKRQCEWEWLFARHPDDPDLEQQCLGGRFESMESSEIISVLKAYEKKHNSQSSLLRYLAASTLYERERFEEAADCTRDYFLSLGDTTVPSAESMWAGEIYFAAGRIAEAAQAFAAPRVNMPDPEYQAHSLPLLARCCIREGKIKEAAVLLRQAEARMPELGEKDLAVAMLALDLAKEELKQVMATLK